MELAQNICTLADRAFMEWRCTSTVTLSVRPRDWWDACSIKFTPLQWHILITAEGLEYKVLRSEVQQFDDLLAFLIEAGVDRLHRRFRTEDYFWDQVMNRGMLGQLFGEEPTKCGFHITNADGEECYALHCSEQDVIEQALKYARNFRLLSYHHNPTAVLKPLEKKKPAQ
jgi:hypothetical protein